MHKNKEIAEIQRLTNQRVEQLKVNRKLFDKSVGEIMKKK